jgi:predicted lipase
MILNPLTYALLAQDAYSAIPQIGEESSSARAIIQSTIDGTAFAFPGTDNVACWLADLDCAVADTPLGRIHKGFNDAAMSIVSMLERQATATPGQIVLCGHSEGAALALIIGGYLCKAGRPPLAIFAFEPPRVTTDDRLGAVLQRNSVKLSLYRQGFDVVPLVPRMIEPWQHPAPLTQIGEPAEPFPNVIDHMIERVVAAIRVFVGGQVPA